jgi:hypothetical protein
LVTSGPQEMIVEIEVEKMVEVVNSVVDSGVETAGLLTGLDSIGVLVAGVLSAGVLSTGVLVAGVVSTPWLEDDVVAGVVWAADDSVVVVAADEAGVVAWEVYLVRVVDW